VSTGGERWLASAPSRRSGIGGVPAYRQAGRGAIKKILPFREAPEYPSRQDGTAGELHPGRRKPPASSGRMNAATFGRDVAPLGL